MNKFQTFQEFLAQQSPDVPLGAFVLNLGLAAFLAFVLGVIYVKYGTTISDRRTFARNFVLITMTTTLVITIVKSSLALSLGLVGALSIVRFRAAIKEPEELTYLFLAIAIGLGFGADQREITLAAFPLMLGIIWLKSRSQESEENQNLFLTISSPDPKTTSLEYVIQILKTHCRAVNLKRFDDSDTGLEATFLVEYDGYPDLERCRKALKNFNEGVRLTFLENKGISPR